MEALGRNEQIGEKVSVHRGLGERSDRCIMGITRDDDQDKAGLAGNTVVWLAKEKGEMAARRSPLQLLKDYFPQTQVGVH